MPKPDDLPSTVVTLPTAAPKRVRQIVGCRERARLKGQLPQHPATFIPPFARRMIAEKVARKRIWIQVDKGAWTALHAGLLMLEPRADPRGDPGD